MRDFCQDLKTFMLHTCNDNGFDIMDHYVNLKQHEKEIKDILNDCELYEFGFTYEKDDSGGYTDGIIEVYFKQTEYHYQIRLLNDERFWGYCECKSDMSDYIPEIKCCGKDCDWLASSIYIVKINNIASFSYEGLARDMWQSKKEFKQDLVDLINEWNQSEIKRINDSIQSLLERKKELTAELK
jgi:hypothetical protein